LQWLDVWASSAFNTVDTEAYNEALLGDWIRHTNRVSIISVVNRLLFVRLAEAPSAEGSPLRYGEFEGQNLHSSAEDERKIRSLGAAIDAVGIGQVNALSL
jgi:hypothetical protein